MCGLVAILGRNGQAVPVWRIERARAALTHRGPDDTGLFSDGNVALGFQRLAIIDVSPAGHQPMSTPDGNLTIVFNGEIYNYVEIRQELAALGHVFTSFTDTEVLLTAFREWGPDCVHRFNGMWAFVIYDRRTRTFFGARDRLGVKPLYLWQNAEWLVLASEPTAIGATGLTEFQPNWQRVADSVAWNRLDHGDDTCFASIRRIPAGHRFWVSVTGDIRQERFWSVPPEIRITGNHSMGEDQWVERLGELVTDSVRLRLRSDVPVGFTLSGGIDSTLLLCEAARQLDGKRFLAFGYQDSRYDETQQIEDTLRQTGAQFVSVRDSELDPAELLDEIIKVHGEPVHSLAAFANYSLFRLARENGVKVVIGGQGADEVLGGYSSFQGHYWYSLASDLRWRMLSRDLRDFADLHPEATPPKMSSVLLRAARIKISGSTVYRGIANAIGPRFPRDSVTNLFSPDLLNKSKWVRPRASEYRMAEAQRSNVVRWPLPLYMRIEDRSSMAHSVEARLPFTDYRLVEHALRMPDQLKYAGGLNKIALRRVAAARAPASVVSRVKKFGFPVSAYPQAAKRLYSLCADLANSQAFRERGTYCLPAVQKMLELSLADPAAHVGEIFKLTQIELWLRNIGESNRRNLST